MQHFYMMVGLPGSGKSLYAQSIPDAVVHSSDAIRLEIFGDAANQQDPNRVFDTLHARVIHDLSDGKDVVYDATNINYRRRMAFLDCIRSLHLKDLCCVCVFMSVPYRKCVENNIARDRIVSEDTIKRMYEHFDVPMLYEGWDDILIVEPFGRSDVDMAIRSLCHIQHDNPHHRLTIGQHCLAAWGYMHEHYPKSSIAVKRAVLLHDIGKAHTKTFQDARGNASQIAHYYNHERVGAYNSFAFTGDLSLNGRIAVALLIRWHMYPFVVERSQNPKKTARKLEKLIGSNNWNNLLILHECDRNAH